MKIIRKGNLKGLDVDYQVNVNSPEEVDQLHKQLLSKGLLFTYATGDIPYQRFESNVVLHYIDKKFMLYDYAILFTEQAKKEKKERSLDTEYERAQKDPEYKKQFMKFMKYHKILTAFKKHMRAYTEPLQGPYKQLFEVLLADIKKNVIEMDVTDYTIETMRKLDTQLKQLLLSKE
jgi:hypothetical protein